MDLKPKDFLPYIALGLLGYFVYRKIVTGQIPVLSDMGSRIGTGLFDVLHPGRAQAGNAPTIAAQDVPAARQIFNAARARGIRADVIYKALTGWKTGMPDPTLSLTPQTTLQDLL